MCVVSQWAQYSKHYLALLFVNQWHSGYEMCIQVQWDSFDVNSLIVSRKLLLPWLLHRIANNSFRLFLWMISQSLCLWIIHPVGNISMLKNERKDLFSICFSIQCVCHSHRKAKHSSSFDDKWLSFLKKRFNLVKKLVIHSHSYPFHVGVLHWNPMTCPWHVKQ